MIVRLLRLDSRAVMPTRGSAEAAGYDLYAIESGIIDPHTTMIFDTGWAMELPHGYYMKIVPRSGMAMKHGVTIINSPGTIDSDYRGPVKVGLYNASEYPFEVYAGDRIAQAIVRRLEPYVDFREVEELGRTERGEGGLGSTGR